MLSAMAAPVLAAALVAPTPPVLGLHVPWADGAAHLDEHGQLTEEPEAWPRFRVPSVRLWDTRTTWAHLEPRDNAWSFTALDAHLAAAEAHGTTDAVLVLGGTPSWAARDPDAKGAPWLPAGSASPPRDLADWRDYVRTVATRFAGRIDVYQVGNEPNVAWFWQGTRAELADMVRAAVEEIRLADPQATVVAPAPIVTTVASTLEASRWWRALAGTGVDALALQWYPTTGTPPRALGMVVERMRRSVQRTDLSDRPIWITEVNHRAGDAQARQLVTRTMRVAAREGVARVYWYAWTAIGPPGLLTLQQGSPAARALRDYVATSRRR